MALVVLVQIQAIASGIVFREAAIRHKDDELPSGERIHPLAKALVVRFSGLKSFKVL